MQAHGGGSPETRMLHVAIPGDYSTLSSTRDRVEGWNCQIYWWIYMACELMQKASYILSPKTKTPKEVFSRGCVLPYNGSLLQQSR